MTQGSTSFSTWCHFIFTSMSSVYATEPATSGRVIFDTSHGPLEIQLWCRECPATTRFFLQLCLDGYYDNMIFHRIVPNFLIQTGAMRKTSPSSSSSDNMEMAMKKYRKAINADAAIERAKYEIHSRLRFNHRGQVAMALNLSETNTFQATDEDDQDRPELQPQFFITLEEASFLDTKHVLFGTITGPTFFNALRMGQVEVDEATHQPVDFNDAPTVKSVKIVDNPIHADLTAQVQVPWHSMANKVNKSKTNKAKRKGKLDVNVLSFGDEMDDVKATVNHNREKSRHYEGDSQQTQTVNAKARQSKDKGSKENDEIVPGEPDTSKDDHDLDHHASSPLILASNIKGGSDAKSAEAATASHSIRSPPSSELPPSRPHAAEAAPTHANDHGTKPKGMSLLEAERAKYSAKAATKNKRKREEDTMTKLWSFQQKVRQSASSNQSTDQTLSSSRDNGLAARMARRAEEQSQREPPLSSSKDDVPSYHGQVLDNDDPQADGQDWFRTRFQCKRHIDNGDLLGGDGRDMDDYEVVDDRTRRRDHGDHGFKQDRHPHHRNSNKHHDRTHHRRDGRHHHRDNTKRT